MSNNYQNNNHEPLQNTVHWRGMKNLFYTLCTYEHIDPNGYNFNNICCYSCVGEELQGTNVKYPSIHHGNSCFVYDNEYDMFEVPAKSYDVSINKFSYTGDYLFLAHDKSFDYWLFGKMSYEVDLDSTATQQALIDQASFAAYGQYKVTFTDIHDFSFVKETAGPDCNFGGSKFKGKFDKMGSRKKAYHTSTGQVVAGASGKNHNINGLKGGNKVRVYKKTKRKQ